MHFQHVCFHFCLILVLFMPSWKCCEQLPTCGQLLEIWHHFSFSEMHWPHSCPRCTGIVPINYSIVSLQFNLVMSQPTLRRAGARKNKIASSHEENVCSSHQYLFEENVRKKQKGVREFWKRRFWESFTHKEGISTPCVCPQATHSSWDFQ